MKKLLVALVAVGALAVPAVSQAWVQDGICRLHAYNPSAQGGGVAAHGRVDTCGGITGEAEMTLQVCLQVQGANGIGAFTVSGTCSTLGPYNALSMDSWSNVNTNAVHGHVYRTWDWARVNGSTAWYTSSWVTY
jgi:hypothetical protein